MDKRNEILNDIARLSEQIEKLEEKAKPLRERRAKLKKKLYEGRTNELRGADSLLVLRSDIRPSIAQWIELYDRQHGGGGQLMLAERSKVSTRLIRSITNENGEGSYDSRRFVTLQTADRLLQACNLSHRIPDLEVYEVNGTKPVVPDPPFHHFEED